MEGVEVSMVGRGVLRAVLVVVMVAGVVVVQGCASLDLDELDLGFRGKKNEKIETQSESLQDAHLRYGPIGAYCLCPCIAWGHHPAPDVCVDSRVSTKHPCDAPSSGSNSSLFCPE